MRDFHRRSCGEGGVATQRTDLLKRQARQVHQGGLGNPEDPGE